MLLMYRFPKYLNNVSYTLAITPHTPRKGENERHTHATPTPHANEHWGRACHIWLAKINSNHSFSVRDWLKLLGGSQVSNDLGG